MSVATTRSWATLPAELLSLIHENLAEDFLASKAQADLRAKMRWDTRPRNKRTALPPTALKQVALVNRHWHAVANENLYRAIFIHREQTSQRLLKAVTSNPQLLVLIKFVTVDYKYNSLPTQPKAAKKALAIRKKTSNLTWQFLHKLLPGRIQELDVDVFSLQPSSDALGIDLPCLRGVISLSISMDRSNSAPLFGQIVHQWLGVAAPTLQRLSADLKYGRNVTGSVIPDDLHLKSLRLVDRGGFDESSLRRLLAGTSLECLSLVFPVNITIPTEDLRRALMHVAPQLKGLHVELHNRFPLAAQEFIETLTIVLPMCHSLRVAHFLLAEEDVDNVIKHLPTSLKKVVVSVELVEWSSRLTCIAAMGKTADAILALDLPSLRRVTVTSRTILLIPHDSVVPLGFLELEKQIAIAATKEVELDFSGLFPAEVTVDL